MSIVETIIQSIQDGIEKITDGAVQLREASFKDIVKEEKLDEKYLIDDDAEDKMSKSDIRTHYQGEYDKYEEKICNLENDKKQLDTCFQRVENTMKQMEEILNSRDSIKNAFDININNIKIVMNTVIENISKYTRRDDKSMKKLSLHTQKHIDPKSKQTIVINKVSPKIASTADRLKASNKYVIDNIPSLESWSGKKYSSVLYDSEIDSKRSSVFRKKIMKHSQLYFIVVDSDNNVFGHYHPGVIDKLGNVSKNEKNLDDGIFLFTLNSNGRSKVTKYNNRKQGVNTQIFNGKHCYQCGYDNHPCFCIQQIDTNKSEVYSKRIRQTFGVGGNTLTGNHYPTRFITKRIIVIQMK